MTLPNPRNLALASLALALVASASSARAQEGLVGLGKSRSAGVTITASRRQVVAEQTGGVITTPFLIANTTADSLAVTAQIALPKGWTMVSAIQPSVIAPAGSELWLVSVAPPASAKAGRYIVRAQMGIKRQRKLVTGEVWGIVERQDSVIVTIPERRELDLRTGRTAGFVIAGESYSAVFTVRNRGNLAAHLNVAAKSNHGAAPKLDVTRLDLDPGAIATISASVAVNKSISNSAQDLLELAITGVGSDTSHVETSVETTIIPVTNGDAMPLWSLPGQVALRGAPKGTGVSPFVAWGSGRISQTSNTMVDFSVRTSAGPASIFGERDEYRIGLRGDRLGVRLGDDSYGFSILTASGIQGTGGELKGSAGPLTAGAYVQRNRWNPTSTPEAAVMIGTSPRSSSSVSMIVVERGTTGSKARVVSASAGQSLFGSRIDIEAAKSDSGTSTGEAATARLVGVTPIFTYDVGASTASTGFSGAQRASTDEHATISSMPTGPLTLTASAARHTMIPTALSSGFGQRNTTASLSAYLSNGSALEYERFDRNDQGASFAVRGNQQSIRLRTRLHAGFIDLLGSVQRGVVVDLDSTAPRNFMAVNGSLRTSLGTKSYISLFGDMTDGFALGGGGVGTVTGGTSADLSLPFRSSLRISASATAQRDRIADWSSQGDVSLEHSLGKAIVALRGRIAESGSSFIPPTHAFFLEVRTPLNVPMGRVNPGGRVHGRIVDSETGLGVKGALVRVGSHAAITDAKGDAEFVGLEPGEYHPVVERGIAAGLMVSGSSSIKIVAREKRASGFQLSVGRGARIAVRIRRYEAVHGSGPSAADSMIEVGAVGQTNVALISARDTAWQTSDDNGNIDFGSVAAGHYTVAVMTGDIPEFYAFEKSRIELDVLAGEEREIELRMLPQQRTVQFMGGETVLVAAPAKAKTPPKPKTP